MILMVEHLEFALKVTKALNELGDAPEGMHLRVLLAEDDTFETLGSWCDEFGSDSWYFQSEPYMKNKDE